MHEPMSGDLSTGLVNELGPGREQVVVGIGLTTIRLPSTSYRDNEFSTKNVTLSHTC
jgi:hypothetical protein